MTGEGEAPALVLGLGNVLCGDDGLGVIALERLRRHYVFPSRVELVDGGTLGLSLLPTLEQADEVWILDAVSADAPAGTLISLDGANVEPALRERLSPHQVGVADLMDALHWRDTWPASVRVLGLVPASVELRLGLSDAVAGRLDSLIDAAVCSLTRAGFAPVRRSSLGDDHAFPRPAGDDRIARALGL